MSAPTFVCPEAAYHGNPFRYCPVKGCGWMETPPPKTGAQLIADERKRQVDVEGWTSEHDAEYTSSALTAAAVCYATPADLREVRRPGEPQPALWPWEVRFWKPTPDDRVRELVKAGALIAAEIDRLQAAS